MRNVLGGQAFATISLPYGLSLTVKGDLNNSTSNNKKYDNPEIGDGATNGGRLTSYAYQYKTVTLQEILSWNYQFNQVYNVEAMVAHENYSWGAQVHFRNEHRYGCRRKPYYGQISLTTLIFPEVMMRTRRSLIWHA